MQHKGNYAMKVEGVSHSKGTKELLRWLNWKRNVVGTGAQAFKCSQKSIDISTYFIF